MRRCKARLQLVGDSRANEFVGLGQDEGRAQTWHGNGIEQSIFIAFDIAQNKRHSPGKGRKGGLELPGPAFTQDLHSIFDVI